MKEDILKTYRCLLSHVEKMPGAKIEDVFARSTLPDLQKEVAYIQDKLPDDSQTCRTCLKGRMTCGKDPDITKYSCWIKP